MMTLTSVVNCFQISTFAYQKQPPVSYAETVSVVNCFQISTFAYQKQPFAQHEVLRLVVNCFQISTFAYQKQLPSPCGNNRGCCELLSN